MRGKAFPPAVRWVPFIARFLPIGSSVYPLDDEGQENTTVEVGRSEGVQRWLLMSGSEQGTMVCPA